MKSFYNPERAGLRIKQMIAGEALKERGRSQITREEILTHLNSKLMSLKILKLWHKNALKFKKINSKFLKQMKTVLKFKFIIVRFRTLHSNLIFK
jgi:hypothetical protein